MLLNNFAVATTPGPNQIQTFSETPDVSHWPKTTSTAHQNQPTPSLCKICLNLTISKTAPHSQVLSHWTTLHQNQTLFNQYSPAQLRQNLTLTLNPIKSLFNSPNSWLIWPGTSEPKSTNHLTAPKLSPTHLHPSPIRQCKINSTLSHASTDPKYGSASRFERD